MYACMYVCMYICMGNVKSSCDFLKVLLLTQIFFDFRYTVCCEILAVLVVGNSAVSVRRRRMIDYRHQRRKDLLHLRRI